MKADIELHQRMMQRDHDSQQQAGSANEKDKGLLIIFTGAGKGKSTAAFGMGLRVLSHQMKLGVVQFIGNAKESAEYRSFSTHPNCDFQVVGADCSWASKDRNADMIAVAKGWAEAIRMIEDPSYHMVILDDLNLLLKYQYIGMDQVLRAFKRRRAMLHIVVTGRHAPFELTDTADLVSEMRLVKHPYLHQGIAAQSGVEF